MRKILIIALCGLFVFGLTGCGNDKADNENNSNENINSEEKEVSNNTEDNKELIETLNNAVSELYNEAKEKSDFSLAMNNIIDRLKEKQINEYTFTAICDKEFDEKPNITGYTSPAEKWTSDAKNIENYDGKCNYITWVFTEYSNGEDYNILVLDTNNDYYNVTVSFKKIKFNDKDRYYPTFSNSKLLG